MLTKKVAAVNYFCYVFRELELCEFYTHKLYCMVDLSHNNNKAMKNNEIQEGHSDEYIKTNLKTDFIKFEY